MKRIRGLPDGTPGLKDYLEVETQGASWDAFHSHLGGRAHRGLIEELVDLQHGLCGYCEIRLTELDRQVEHVVPQSDPVQGASRALDFRNLIACCKGGTWRSSDGSRYLRPVRQNRTCGEEKGARRIKAFLDPRELPAAPSLARVLEDGLNARRLRIARERRWRALSDAWGEWTERLSDPDQMHEAARRELLPANGRLSQFFTTARSYFGPLAERVLDEPPRAWI